MTRTGVVFALSFILFILSPLAHAADKAAVRRALVIGQNVPEKPSVPTLKYADDDAVAIHQMLTQAGVRSSLFVSLDADSQSKYDKLKIDGPPTRQHVLSAFIDIRKDLEKAAVEGRVTSFYFFFSGHGDVEHGEGYLVMEGGRLTRSDLSDLLAGSPANHNHVMIDACKSYFMAFEKGPGGTRTKVDGTFVGSAAGRHGEHTGFVLSTSSARQSHEWERFSSGVFSHEILSALRGAADADGDGAITYAELGGFLDSANKNLKNETYRPNYFLKPPGPFPGDVARTLLVWPKSANSVIVDIPKMGHFYVESRSGHRLADANPDSEQTMRIRLPAERPLYVRKADDSLEWKVDSLGTPRLSRAGAQKVESKSKGSAHEAFARLFEAPFGAKDVRAFRSDFARSAQLVASLGGPPSGGVEMRKMAVLSMQVDTQIEKGKAATLNEVLLSEFQSHPGLEVLGASDIQAVLRVEEQRTKLGSCSEDSCLAELGGALGVPLLASASLGSVGDNYVVSLKVIDVRNSRVLSRTSQIVGKEESALIGAVQKSVSLTAARLGLGGSAVSGPTAELPEAQPDEEILSVQAGPGTEASTLSTLTWASLSLTLVSGLATGVVGGLSLLDASAASDEFEGSERWQDKNDAAKKKALAADILLGVTAGFAVLTLVAYLAEPDSADEPAVDSVSLVPVPGGVSAGLSVRF